jgi:hypothetical protein
MSMPRASKLTLSSLTRAMLTNRNTFSVSLTASAVRVSLTGTVTVMASYSAQATRRSASESAPTILGIEAVVKAGLPGSSRSGE